MTTPTPLTPERRAEIEHALAAIHNNVMDLERWKTLIGEADSDYLQGILENGHPDEIVAMAVGYHLLTWGFATALVDAEEAERQLAEDWIWPPHVLGLKLGKQTRENASLCQRAEDAELIAWGLAQGIIKRGAEVPTGDTLMDHTWWLETVTPGIAIGMGFGHVPVLNRFTDARAELSIRRANHATQDDL